MFFHSLRRSPAKFFAWFRTFQNGLQVCRERSLCWFRHSVAWRVRPEGGGEAVSVRAKTHSKSSHGWRALSCTDKPRARLSLMRVFLGESSEFCLYIIDLHSYRLPEAGSGIGLIAKMQFNDKSTACAAPTAPNQRFPSQQASASGGCPA